MDKYSITCTTTENTADTIFLKWKMYQQENELSKKQRVNDEELIQFIYDQYANDLLSYGLKLGYRKDVLEDAIQDLFYKLCRTPQLLRQVGELKFYLFRALKNRLLNISKSTANLVTMELPEFKLATKEDSLHLLIEEEDRVKVVEKVNYLLNSLSDKQREIMYLRYIHEMSYEEIGELMNMTPPSVKNVVYKAMMKMRK